MQVLCIRDAYGHKAGDLVDVPDGASVSPVYFEVPADETGQGGAALVPPPAPNGGE